MRDFRDSKVIAQTLRAALATKGYNITNSQSLELIAEAFGAADWNTLAAAIRDQAEGTRKPVTSTSLTIAESDPLLPFSPELDLTLHRAFAYAKDRKHQYATLEHLTLALIDDADASAVARASSADIDTLRENLAGYLDIGLTRLMVDSGGDPRPTAAFQRVIQRAARENKDLGHPSVTGANVLTGIFAETESPAARFLGAQGMPFRTR